MMIKKSTITLLIFTTLLVFCQKSSFGQITYVWSGGTSGSWNTPSNWKVGGVTQILLYPGSNILVSNDIAQIPASSSTTTITVTGTLTIGQLTNSGYNTAGMALVLSGSSTSLTVSSGFTISQLNGAMTGLALSGSGSATFGGTSTLGYNQSMSIASGTTVNFSSGSTLDITASQGTVTNNGTLNFTNSSFKLAYQNALVSPGKVVATGTDFYIPTSTSTAYITYGGVFNATNCTFEVPSHCYIKGISLSSLFTATSSTFTLSGSGGAAYIENYGNWRDHGSTYYLTGQLAYFQTDASSTMHLSGSTIYLGTTGNGNGGQVLNNAGTLTVDSTTNINVQGYQAAVTNSGTGYYGTSGSSCIITLTAQATNVTNSGTAYLGSTSIIYPTGNVSYITNSSSGSFTLQSDANGSAAIGALNSTVGSLASVNGKFNVERYYQGSSTYNSITGRWLERNYRIISSPVYNATTSGVNDFGLNYIVGSTAGQTTAANSTTNAFITGCTGGSTSSGNPSIYLYRESYTPSNATYTSGNFLGITNITNSTSTGAITCSDGSSYTIPIGTGVFFFDRGAATNWSTRTVAPYIAPESVTLTNNGTVNTFSVSVRDWYTPSSTTLAYTGSGSTGNYKVRGFNMVGNPYPCTIDWCTAYSSTGITRSSTVSPTIWVFDPQNNQYSTFIATSASGGVATGKASRYIMSGEGFFIQATASSSPAPTLTFTESAKAPTQQSTGTTLLMGAPVQMASNAVMRLKVMIDTLNYDDIALVFNSSASTNYNSAEDAPYIRAEQAPEGLSSFSEDSVQLSINSVPLPGLTQRVIRLKVDATHTGTFALKKTQLDAIPKIYKIWLMDYLKKDSLDLRANSTYLFDVKTSDTSTFGANRFALVIRQDPALAVHLLNFTANKATDGSQVAWVTENEENYTNFTLQRSIDGGKTFDDLYGVASSAQGKYSFLDQKPVTGANAYRLKIVDLNGTISYSNVVTLMYANINGLAASNIRIYPNPASGIVNLQIDQNSGQAVSGQSQLQSRALNPGTSLASSAAYEIKIINVGGTVVRTASSSQPSWQQNISDLSPGTYVLKVVNTSNNSVVGSGTFIKI